MNFLFNDSSIISEGEKKKYKQDDFGEMFSKSLSIIKIINIVKLGGKNSKSNIIFYRDTWCWQNKIQGGVKFSNIYA